ncbi:MAG TPA: MFS transporter, partial [Polyangiales bacterium]|nr:MFS transporter [Polyangiales bacterium]
SVNSMQWVVEAYALSLASLVLIGGALGDRHGRRRVFALGALVFGVASAGCGLAPNATALVLARGLQGVGGALLVPGSLALISAAYGERERGAAIGTWSAASAITGALAPVAGGWLVAHASWRWLFWVNVPIAIAVAWLATAKVVESRDPEAPAAMDWLGAALVVSGLGSLVYGLIERGAAAHGGVTPIVIGLSVLALFLWVEARSAAPMVPLALFRSATFSGANLLTLLLYAALGAAMFFLPFNLIQAQHYTPAAAGAALLPFVLLISLLSRWSGRFAERRGARMPLTVGPLLAAAGFSLLAMPGLDSSYARDWLPGIVLLGLGMGVTVAPLTAAVMGAVEQTHAGVASGINNAIARTAGLLAIAALGLILVQVFGSALLEKLDPLALAPSLETSVLEQQTRLAAPDLSALPETLQAPIQHAFELAFITGFRVLMLACAALSVLAALTAALSIDRQAAAVSEPSG